MLQGRGLPVETGTGGQTKYNRNSQGYPKAHWLDAACVGESGFGILANPEMQVLVIEAMGRGSRQMCRVNKYGFPRTSAKSQKRVKGFQTGDMVRAVVGKGKKKGCYEGRVAVRSSGSFNLKTKGGTVQGIGHKHCRLLHRHCRLLHRQDGYMYSIGVSSPTQSGLRPVDFGRGLHAHNIRGFSR